MKRLVMIAAMAPWVGGAVPWSGCAHGQRDRYEELQDAFEKSVRGGVGHARAEEPLPFSTEEPLRRATLVTAVLERNPDVEAARQAWRGALARHPQARALQDTMASYSLAPLSIGSDEVQFGQVVRLEQRFPTPGKLRFAGEVALAEAEAEAASYESVRLNLALMASSLFDEYYRITRLLTLNE